MDPGKIFQIITNSTLLATRLLSGTGRPLIEFTQHRYCATLREDEPTSSDVITVMASHKEGASVKYSITGGNRDGLFTIDQKTGLITLAATLDYELYDKHELVVSAEGGGQVVHTMVEVAVADVNDNPPVFTDQDPHVTVIEEDDRHLPTTLMKVEAKDPDHSDEFGLLYTLRGDGVDGHSPDDAFFKINPRTGDLVQLRALDRDPPNGKRIWKLRVKVQDGQEPWKATKRHKGTKNTPMTSRDHSPSWDYENGLQNDQPTEDTVGRNAIETRPNKNSGSKWERSRVQEDETVVRLWEIRDNGYDMLASLQNGGSSARKHAWTRELNQKYKAKPFLWTSLSDRQHPYTQHAWKFKEIGHKDTKQLSWNDQARFGIPKSVYNYKNEENSNRNSWELSKRIRDEKRKDKWASSPGSRVGEREERGEATELRFMGRRSNIGDHIWHVNRLRESLSDPTNRRITDGQRAKFENTNQERGLRERGMKDRISLSKSKSAEFLVSSQDTSIANSQEKSIASSRSRLSSFASAVKNQKTEITTSDGGDQHKNVKSNRFFKKGDSTCNGQISTCDLRPKVKGMKQIREKSQSSWSNSLKTRIKFRDETKLHKIESPADDSPDHLISPDTLKDTHISRNTSFKSSTSEWEKIGSIDDDGKLRQESRFVKKAKRSPGGVFEAKRQTSSILNERPSLTLGTIESKTSSSSTVHSLESIQEPGEQFRFYHSNDIKEKKTENIPAHFTKAIESSPSILVFSNGTKKPSTNVLPESEIDSVRKGVIANSGLYSKDAMANSNKVNERFHNLMSNSSEPTASPDPLDQQMDGFTPRNSSDAPSHKMSATQNYPNKKYLSSHERRQTLNEKLLLTSSGKRNSSLSETQNLLPDLVARNRSTESSVRKRESKWVLKKPRGKGWLSRGARDIIMESPFDNFDSDEEQCYEASRVGVSVTDEAGNRKEYPVHEVEILVTVIVKDINDNAPIFPNVTMYGEVQENGPVDLPVVEVSAWDADDATEGSNARITYAIEKNVIHDRSGEAVFSVHPHSGLVTTALCCLDRETTPEYQIQVVASDGGGLKGTGTVVVRLTDENDNSPRLARQYWELEVDETWGDGPPNNMTLLEMTAADPDTKNHFSYKIVEESGWGWDHFGIRSTGASGQLYALRALDYEDDTHRQGFKFMVQVTDRGEGGWVDPRHQDTAWVGVRLRDLNDNPPQFVRPHAHVTISEDAPLGTLLTTVSAHDPDAGGGGQVDYSVVGGWNSLQVDESGGVTLSRRLDREAEEGALGIARILGTDRGEPPLTATATLTITVTDVNDCAPRILPPDVLHVREGDPPVLLGVLTATDDDMWSLGHGPPFSMSLSPSNPSYVMDFVSLKFYQHVDSGRGGAELWTRGSLDRESHRTLPVEVVVGDAGGLNRTQTVTVVVDDRNDNPMKPAAKTVYLWKTQGSGSDAPLGRVYVDDPDDWDVADKTFRWAGKPHPLFTLNADDGSIFASSLVREGRYLLHFAVSDRVWGQVDVAANVTVVVRTLTHDALTHATPVILTPITPADLTRGWAPTNGGGGLGKLLEAVHDIISEGLPYKVDVVSVYGNNAPPGSTSTVSTSPETESSPSHPQEGEQPVSSNSSSEPPAPTVYVWVSVKNEKDVFVDPVRLQGMLSLHKDKLEKATGLSVSLKDPPPVFDEKGPAAQQVPQTDALSRGYPPHLEGPEDSSLSTLKLSYEDAASVTSSASTALPLQVVDANVTSLVTPLLIRRRECGSRESSRGRGFALHDSDTCVPSSCLNGGRCLRFPSGSRCVCPGGSWGPQCKILSRTFRGSGWVWLKPLPPCLPTTLSLRVLTSRPHGLLLYSGPLDPHSQPLGSSHWSLPSPMLALQVVERKPQLIVEGIGSSFVLEVNASVTDGEWHTIHLHLHSQGVVLMVDFCGLGWDETISDDSHCVARKSWDLPGGLKAWEALGPLQIGGLAQGPQWSKDYGWSQAPTPHSLDGCLSNLNVNDQLMDLGEPAFSKDSTTGCQPQETACPGVSGSCGMRGACAGGLNHPECRCDPGWTGPSCNTPTVPATLRSKSYMKLALSFTPSSGVTSVQLRVRALGEPTGMLVRLAAQHTHHSFTVQLRAGVACASVSGAGWAARGACVEGRPVGDGHWHTVRAERHGHNLLISVDGGDEWRVNRSIPSLVPEETSLQEEDIVGPPVPSEIDKLDGVTVGGLPEFLGVKLVTVGDDLQDACIDDLRVSDRQLPLPPAVNGSTWGQVTTLNGFMKGCNPPPSCLNTTCDPPLSCHASWTQPSCSCGSGRHLVGSACEDTNECLMEPCLHGGTCHDLRPGYLCLCRPNHFGSNCEWTELSSTGHPLTAPAAIAAVTLSLLVLVLLGVCLSIRHHRLRTARALGRQETQQSPDKTPS
ncbi:neural-cadherin-like [Macrobrachium nipponense]|uniref:neural-cadherin-like n=1 Tax=Macrobrachium nipponense TaxID=159736 RepID=UPI0030C82FAE